MVASLLSPVAVGESLRSIQLVMDSACADWERCISKGGGAVVNGYDEIRQLAFKIICSVVLGDSFLAYTSFGAVVEAMTDPRRSFIPFWKSLPLDSNRRLENSVQDLRAAVVSFVRAGVDHSAPSFRNSLDRLISELGEDIAVDNLVSFLFAGHETTAAFLAFALFHLASDPALQADLLAEFDASSPPRGGRLFAAFTKEVLRVYPPAPALGRTCLSVDRLPTGDVILPGVCLFHLSLLRAASSDSG